MSIIKKIRTVRVREYSNLTWVEIETDDGLTGLGEVWRGAEAVESAVHTDIENYLLGKDARNIERISRDLTTPYVGYHSSGAEIRAASAVDIALWDLFGKRMGVPVWEVLGGASRDKVKLYNTCSGYRYNATATTVSVGAGRRIASGDEEMRGPYDDQVAFEKDAGKLAESLLAEGYSVMKIWPFDKYAVSNSNNLISLTDVEKGLVPFQKIREKAGKRMEFMCEMHGIWNVPSAIRIMKALAPYEPLWVEDPLCKMDDFDALRMLKDSTGVPICGCETLSGPLVFRQLLQHGVLDYSMVDLGWCGGLSEGRKIAVVADSFNVPVAPHDCTGPILLWAGMHLAFHAGNAVFMEVVRANMATWYKDLVDFLPEVNQGFCALPTRPGLGAALKPEVKERPDAVIRETTLN